MIQIDVGQIQQLEHDLWLLSTKAGPYANAQALNSMAFQAQQGARLNIKQDFVNRNPWTARSVQVDRARVGAIGSTYSAVGSVASYMERQEVGGTKGSRGRRGVPIATKEASGEGRGGGVRRRTPRARNMLSALTLTKRGKRTVSQKQRNVAAVGDAAANGGGVVYLDLGRRKGLFRVTGGRGRPKVTMLYDLSHKTVPTHAHPWLYPAARFAAMKGPGFYVEALEKQIERQRLFKSKR